MMNRAKGATLAEIMKAPGWQAHTVRGCVSILGSKAGARVDSLGRNLRRMRSSRYYRVIGTFRIPRALMSNAGYIRGAPSPACDRGRHLKESRVCLL